MILLNYQIPMVQQCVEGHLCGHNFQDAKMDRKLWERKFESAIGCWLMNEAFHHRWLLYYWLDDADEVDFVLRRLDKIVALEVIR